VKWEKWEPGKAASLAQSGEIVYVDFTARWCVTCQTNKAAVFSSKRVLERFTELEVVTLKADWTNQDPEISQALAKFGRSAVPFNLVYGPGLDEPEILPELLTPGIVLEAVESAVGP
jgi:thiol:disulfide interchange protein DsbD